MWNNFYKGLALIKLCVSLGNLQVFTPLYRGLKKTLLIASTSKESLLKLDQITNDLLLDLVIVLGWNNFKSIPCIENYQRSHICCLVLLQTQNRVVEILVVQLHYFPFLTLFSE